MSGNLTVGELALEGVFLFHHMIAQQHPSIVGQQTIEYCVKENYHIDKMADCALYYKLNVCQNVVFLAGSRAARDQALRRNIPILAEWQGTCQEFLNCMAERAFSAGPISPQRTPPPEPPYQKH
jgi:hypothetical protein